MTKPTILVTGATGKTGTQVVTQLRQKGWPVRAVVHKPDARSERLQKLGAEVVVADAYDPEQMIAAMSGVQRAYYCPTVQPFMIQASVVFAVAAREARVESVVHLSMWLAAPAHPAIHTRQQWLNERLMQMIPDAAWTIVNPGVFAEPIIDMLPTAANLGVMPNPFGDMRNAPPSNEDIARVVVGALTDPDKHHGKRYRPTGPDLLTMHDIADTFARVLGRSVKVQAVPSSMFTKAAKVSGAGDFEISNVLHFIDDGKLNVFEVNAPTNDVFEVSGQRPEPFEETVRRYAALPKCQRTMGNKLRAVAEFSKILTTRALDGMRYERKMGQPFPPKPQLAGESPVWRREHDPLRAVDAPASNARTIREMGRV